MYNLSMSYNSTTKAVLPTQVLITNGDSLKNCPENGSGYRTENRVGYRTANRLKNQRGNGVVKTSESSGQVETPAAWGSRARGAAAVSITSITSITYIRSSWVWLAGIAARVWPVLQVVVACSTSLPGSTPTPPGTRRAG